MPYRESSMQPGGRVKQPQPAQHFRRVAISVVVLAATAAFAIQDGPAVHAITRKPSHAAVAHTQEAPSHKTANLGEYGPLIAEFAHLAAKIQEGVQVPAPRTQSKLLGLLPASTSVYLSVANYGEALHQSNQIFNQELHESTVLSDWWQNKVGMAGMMVEGAIEQIHQFTGYLGDEIVISGNVKPKGGSLLIVAEVRKPGLKAFLQQLLEQYGGKNAPVRILTPEQLLTAKATAKSNPVLMLVRPDFLVVSSDIPTLRSFNAQLTRGAGTLASSPFGQRLAQAYQGGVAGVMGADLQQLLALRPRNQQQSEAIFQQSGFSNLKYLIISSRYGAGGSSSSVELTFNGPRQGIAAWLAPPASLGSLDFVSTHAAAAGAFVLKSPAQMFDDIKNIAGAANPMATMGLAQMETELHLNLKDDLFSKLGGEFAFALEGAMSPTPAWKVIVQVTDPDGLQRTFKQLLASMNGKAPDGKGATLQQKNEGGQIYYSLGFFSGEKHQEIAYGFSDGYLIAASTSALLKDAIEGHRTGKGLAKSSEFLKVLPQEHSGLASALIFQNTALTMAAMMQQLPPELAQLFQSLPSQNKFGVMAAYGEENAIRATSNSHQFDVAVPLLVAAIAIPNLMRTRNQASDAAAAATVRTLNTAQAQYSLTYDKGYAPNLAALGSGPDAPCAPSQSHSCLLDAQLGCDSDTWCVKGGFRYSVTAACDDKGCQDYVAVGTPANSNAGGKSFCSTQDMVVRSKSGPPLTTPVSVAECQTWDPL